MCTPSGPEGAQQSGSYKVPSALGNGGAGVRTRPGAHGEEPQPGSKTLPSQAGQQALGRGSRGSGHCPGSISSPGLCPPLQAACPHRAAPGLLGCFLPLYSSVRIRKGSAWSSWRQEGACSQGHLELSGEACPSPKSPPEPGGQQGQEGAWPFPQTQHRFQLRTRGRQDTGESKRANLGTAPTVPAPPSSLKSSWASCLLDH